jgi:hypothetical protein
MINNIVYTTYTIPVVLFYLFKNGTNDIKIGRSIGQAFAVLAVMGGVYSLIVPYINHSPKERFAEVVEKQKFQIPKSNESDYLKQIKKVKFD